MDNIGPGAEVPGSGQHDRVGDNLSKLTNPTFSWSELFFLLYTKNLH